MAILVITGFLLAQISQLVNSFMEETNSISNTMTLVNSSTLTKGKISTIKTVARDALYMDTMKCLLQKRDLVQVAGESLTVPSSLF